MLDRLSILICASVAPDARDKVYMYHSQLKTDPDYQREIVANNISDTTFRKQLKELFFDQVTTRGTSGSMARSTAYECITCTTWRNKKDAESREDGRRRHLVCGICDGALTLVSKHEYIFMLKKRDTSEIDASDDEDDQA